MYFIFSFHLILILFLLFFLIIITSVTHCVYALFKYAWYYISRW